MAGQNVKILYAKGSNLTEDSILEQRATMFGKTLGRDNRTAYELMKEALDVTRKQM